MTYKEVREKAIQELKQYGVIDLRLNRIRRRLEIVEIDLTDHLPNNSSSATNSTEEYIIELIKEKEKLLKEQRQAKLFKEDMEEVLNYLGREDRGLLMAVYGKRTLGSIKVYCEAHYIHRSSVYRKAEKTLDRFIYTRYGEFSR